MAINIVESYLCYKIVYIGHLTVADLRVVRSAVWEARKEWKNIGIELDLIVTDLDVIKDSNSGNVVDCLTEMLSLWLKKVDPLPTWSTLVRALKQPAVGFEQLAEDLELVHIKDNGGLSAEVAKLSFPFIKEIVLDDHTREQLEGRLRSESKKMIQEFHILRCKFFTSLRRQRVPIGELVEYLKEEISDPLLRHNEATLEDIKEIIRKYTSFFDYQLIEYMIKLTGTDKDAEQLELYEISFMDYAKRRIYECPTIFGSPDNSTTEFHVKLDSKYDKWTLKELKDFQYRLCSKLSISVYVCRLLSVQQGCLLITFQLPSHIYERTFPISRSIVKDLMQLDVLELSYEKNVINLQSNVDKGK